jgi:hypothetical protein
LVVIESIGVRADRMAPADGRDQRPGGLGDRLEDAQAGRRAGRDHAAQRESSLREQAPELLFGALTRTEEHEHVEVHPDRLGPVVSALREDRVDHEQPGLGRHRLATAVEDAPRAGVIPVVDHAREQVGVGAAGHRVEEVTDAELRPIAQTRGREPLRRALHRLGAIEQDAAQTALCLQDRLHQHARAAAEIDEAAQAREVVGRDDVVGLALGPGGH